MPTNRTRRARSHRGLDHWKIDDLLTGRCFLSTGYRPANATGGCGHWTDEEWAEVHAAMRADWNKYGADFMVWWRGGSEQFTAAYASIGGNRRDPSVTPWALTEFGEPK